MLLYIEIKSESILNATNEQASNKVISSVENSQFISEHLATTKKENRDSSIQFLDSSNFVKNFKNKNENLEKEEYLKSSSLNQISHESRFLQAASQTGTESNNKTSFGAAFSNTTTSNTSSISNLPLLSNKTVFIYPKCLSDSDCSGNGMCDLASGKCTCNKTFISIFNNKTANISTLGDYNITYYDYSAQKMCNYEQKKQLTAFMLSIFVGFGAEHFYLARTSIGIAKLVFYVFCGFLNVFYLILYKCVPGGEKYVSFLHSYEALYLGCGVGYMLLWNIYDWVYIGYNQLLDGNNIAMSPWGY